MAIVIAQTEMMKYQGKDRAVFPVGTVITPSAKDWARENRIEIVFDKCPKEACTADVSGPDSEGKLNLLNRVIEAIEQNSEKQGSSLRTEEFSRAVAGSLEKLGCRILD